MQYSGLCHTGCRVFLGYCGSELGCTHPSFGCADLSAPDSAFEKAFALWADVFATTTTICLEYYDHLDVQLYAWKRSCKDRIGGL